MSARRIWIVVFVAIIIVTALAAYFVVGSFTGCSITGQPGGLQLRILSDSTLRPVTGTEVRATSTPATCNNFFPATSQTTITFSTNGQVWYSFPTDNYTSYSFTIIYLSQNYDFKADLAPASITCATLYVPSGKTNITTNGYGSSC
jgi:hypothetical protein